MSEVEDEVTDWVERFHAAVDSAARPVHEANASRLTCARGCAGCCVDELTVFTIEASVIVRHHGELLSTEAPHPEGACAFLNERSECRIYEHRPYVCRTQGLPLRWLEIEATDEEALIESRDICPLNLDGGPPLEELPSEALWTIGPFEQRLAERAETSRSGGARVRLRGLFQNPSERQRLPVLK